MKKTTKALLIFAAFEVVLLSVIRYADAKKPSLDTFFEMASVLSHDEIAAMSNKQIEQTAQIFNN
jgi:hypothetical protein